MKYPDCKEKLYEILGDQMRLSLIEDEFGEIEEMFVASSDFTEMSADFEMIREHDFDLEEDLLTAGALDYALYVLTLDGELSKVPEDLY